MNLGTSIGGAVSPLGAARSVVSLGQAEQDGLHIPFMRYLAVGLPLVIINSLVTFGILMLKFY